MGNNSFPKVHGRTHALGGIDPIDGAGPVPGPNNSRFVLSLADLPAPVGGLVTLEPGQDYVVVGPVDMGSNTLLVAGASIRGYAPQTAALFWNVAASGLSCVRLGDGGWIENLTLTSAASIVIGVEGTGAKRVQLCDLVSPPAGNSPGLFVAPGADGLQCFDTFFRGRLGLILMGGAHVANPSFDLVGSGATARAIQVLNVVIAAGILIESAQVRFDDAGQCGMSFESSASFAAGYQGLLSGLQCSGPGAALRTQAVPLGWYLSGNAQAFEGTYTLRRVVGPAAVTLGPEDQVVECDSTAGAITVNIPQTFTGHDLSIRDTAGAAGVNAITCAGAAGADIDGAASVAINSAYGYLELFAAVAFPSNIDWWISSGG